ncbi:uncharacterized protein F5147DRAFT_689909 [Suillus discolor]|uniref:Uncharacterized protein n=1 Tax=Suillus discolor TaxID=1912936 RepID=A0A9P7F9I3_9AGAM|nr:uncharacterized protein F5147DRAFT_689909 [Suillus discolor]KAG2110278.1 hypothetical protein F5147DRAFT_689909 [Suillus discolor]
MALTLPFDDAPNLRRVRRSKFFCSVMLRTVVETRTYTPTPDVLSLQCDRDDVVLNQVYLDWAHTRSFTRRCFAASLTTSQYSQTWHCLAFVESAIVMVCAKVGLFYWILPVCCWPTFFFVLLCTISRFFCVFLSTSSAPFDPSLTSFLSFSFCAFPFRYLICVQVRRT